MHGVARVGLMTQDVQLSYSRTFPVEVERAFDEVLPYDLPLLFDRRYLAVPPIKAVRAGPACGARWDRPARSRSPTAAPCARR